MKRLLFQVHRWVGVVLALFMLLWFASGLAIIYSGSMAPSRADRLARAEALSPDAAWLSLGEAWERSAGQRLAAGGKGKKSAGDDSPAEARLVVQAGEPRWLVEDGRGRRFTLSALDGTLERTSADQALKIANRWAGEGAEMSYVETVDKPLVLRNQEALAPFHRIAAGGGRELLISERSGEVVHDSTRIDRGLYWAGNWLHMLRPLDAAGLGEWRRDALTWTAGGALAATLTGLIIGWLRWRPGWLGRPTYADGRTQPYRAFWYRWHFWSGLVGGLLALGWALSGYLNNNPWQLFSSATPNREEMSRYLGHRVPGAMFDWKPGSLGTADPGTVELSWRRLGEDAVLLAHGRDGRRLPVLAAGAVSGFDRPALLMGIQRLAGSQPVAVASQTLIHDYDRYYYPRHRAGGGERPLPALKVEIDDEAGSVFYLDPLDGRLLLRTDQSRRAFRWLFSALHHWDIGWLYQRPLWDGWMLAGVLLGLVLSVSSLVVGWKRLRFTFRPGEAKTKTKAVPAAARLAADQQGG